MYNIYIYLYIRRYNVINITMGVRRNILGVICF